MTKKRKGSENKPPKQLRGNCAKDDRKQGEGDGHGW